MLSLRLGRSVFRSGFRFHFLGFWVCSLLFTSCHHLRVSCPRMPRLTAGDILDGAHLLQAFASTRCDMERENPRFQIVERVTGREGWDLYALMHRHVVLRCEKRVAVVL